MKISTLVFLVSALASQVSAGTYHYVSMTETSWNPLGGTCTREINNTNHTFKQTVYYNPYHLFSGQAQCQQSITLKVSWTPSYPGEPAPLSGIVGVNSDTALDCIASSWYGTPVNAMLVVGFGVIPTWAMNFTSTLTAAAPSDHQTEHVENYPYGGLTFAQEGNDWVGTGILTPSTSIGFNAFLGGHSALPLMAGSQHIAKIAYVNSEPVL